MPCKSSYEIYVEDAQTGKYEIEQARSSALSNTLYSADFSESIELVGV